MKWRSSRSRYRKSPPHPFIEIPVSMRTPKKRFTWLVNFWTKHSIITVTATSHLKLNYGWSQITHEGSGEWNHTVSRVEKIHALVYLKKTRSARAIILAKSHNKTVQSLCYDTRNLMNIRIPQFYRTKSEKQMLIPANSSQQEMRRPANSSEKHMLKQTSFSANSANLQDHTFVIHKPGCRNSKPGSHLVIHVPQVPLPRGEGQSTYFTRRGETPKPKKKFRPIYNQMLLSKILHDQNINPKY